MFDIFKRKMFHYEFMAGDEYKNQYSKTQLINSKDMNIVEFLYDLQNIYVLYVQSYDGSVEMHLNGVGDSIIYKDFKDLGRPITFDHIYVFAVRRNDITNGLGFIYIASKFTSSAALSGFLECMRMEDEEFGKVHHVENYTGCQNKFNEDTMFLFGEYGMNKEET